MEEDQELNSFFDPKEMLMQKYPEIMKEENKIILTPRKTDTIDFGSTQKMVFERSNVNANFSNK